MLLSSLNRVRDLVYGDIDKAELGTGVTASTESDTDLLVPDATTLKTLSSITKATKALRFDYELLSTEGATAATYTEAKLNASVAGINYDRVVFTGIDWAKNGTKDLKITKFYYFRGE